MTAQLLTDKSRLPEIYQLRVLAWENSPRNESINQDKYPSGWSEDIDNEAFHFVIRNEKDEIIASARISLHYSVEELPYSKAFKDLELPVERPFAFYSRLVVSPKYRNQSLYQELDSIRVAFIKEKGVAFAIATCKEKRINSLLKSGFEVIGSTYIDFENIGAETIMILKNRLPPWI